MEFRQELQRQGGGSQPLLMLTKVSKIKVMPRCRRLKQVGGVPGRAPAPAGRAPEAAGGAPQPGKCALGERGGEEAAAGEQFCQTCSAIRRSLLPDYLGRGIGTQEAQFVS